MLLLAIASLLCALLILYVQHRSIPAQEPLEQFVTRYQLHGWEVARIGENAAMMNGVTVCPPALFHPRNSHGSASLTYMHIGSVRTIEQSSSMDYSYLLVIVDVTTDIQDFVVLRRHLP
jgi:hypothetical protein